jgi:anti-sigma factor RsiW
VTEYLDGVLDAPARARLEAHLDECGGCERYLAQLRQTVRLAGLLLVS